jgi:hypothetical protein
MGRVLGLRGDPLKPMEEVMRKHWQATSREPEEEFFCSAREAGVTMILDGWGAFAHNGIGAVRSTILGG